MVPWWWRAWRAARAYLLLGLVGFVVVGALSAGHEASRRAPGAGAPVGTAGGSGPEPGAAVGAATPAGAPVGTAEGSGPESGVAVGTATAEGTPAQDKLPFFGMWLGQIGPQHGLAEAVQAGVGVVRHGSVRWRDIEPVRTEPPTYRWGAVKGLDQELVAAAQAGISVTLLVQFTPPWAQAVAGHSCGAIREDALDEFAQFLGAVVERYRPRPFGVRHWELFNEPDVDPSLVGADSVFGCWGDAADPGYGGAAYARMLKAAYPAIKGADPNAQVILGGLLLDDPDKPSARFLEGVLAGGGGDAFDILAFHGYSYFAPGVYSVERLPEFPWSAAGGVTLGKVGFLRRTLAQHGLEKPLILNEAGFGWGGDGEPPTGFRRAQADYVAMLLARGRGLGLANVTWYGWQGPGWRYTALLHPDLAPTQGARAYAFAVRQLGVVASLGPVDLAGLEGYAFRREAGQVQVLWSADGASHPVRFDKEQVQRASDAVGQPVAWRVVGGEVVLDVLRPVYVELAPEPAAGQSR